MKIVLGSSSPFRKQLLDKLHIDFDTCSPDIDESQHSGEKPSALVERLSIEKAKAVAQQHQDSLIISSDQVAIFGNKILGKPGNHENATRQLTEFSGDTVWFITGLCLYNANTGQYQYHQDDTFVQFRQLTPEQIDNYLHRDQPYQCAGSFRSEGLGCALFESIETNDPNALIGLPIIKLVEMLDNEGVDILSFRN